jgi:hypothetical protein
MYRRLPSSSEAILGATNLLSEQDLDFQIELEAELVAVEIG